MLLGHPIDLKAKAGGERSMSEKRGTLEDAEGVVPQDPRDRAKAGLPESQSPAVVLTLVATSPQGNAVESSSIVFLELYLPPGGRWRAPSRTWTAAWSWRTAC